MDPTRDLWFFFFLPIIETIGFFTPNTYLHCRNQFFNLQLWLSLKDKCLDQSPERPLFLPGLIFTSNWSLKPTEDSKNLALRISHNTRTKYLSALKPQITRIWGQVSLRTVNITYTHVHAHIHPPTHTHTGTIAYYFEVKHLKALFPLSHHITLAACMQYWHFKRFTKDPLDLQETKTNMSGWAKVPLRNGDSSFVLQTQEAKALEEASCALQRCGLLG